MSYKITACIVFNTPLSIANSKNGQAEVLAGYYQTFALDAPSESAAQQLLESSLKNENIDWGDSEIVELSWDHAVREKFADAGSILVLSGRSFFPVE